jgi:hypothetical protein
LGISVNDEDIALESNLAAYAWGIMNLARTKVVAEQNKILNTLNTIDQEITWVHPLSA